MNFTELFATAETMRLSAAAVWFARNGVPVFPCVPGAKKPLVSRGFLDATSDWRQVGRWWMKWPDANIGIPTGPASGVEVVDIDVKGERPRGYDSFDRATQAGLLSGWDGQVVTPTGGLHIYFPVDARRPQRSWQAAKPQVDFRGVGGYIIAPPSRVLADRELVPYRLLDLSPHPTVPVDAQRLRDFLDPRPEPRPWPQVRTVAAESVGERAARLARWMGGRMEGERNRSLFWASCRLAEAGAVPSHVHATLGPVAERLGLSPREVETTIRSAYRAVHATPSLPSVPVAVPDDAELVRDAVGRQAI